MRNNDDTEFDLLVNEHDLIRIVAHCIGHEVLGRRLSDAEMLAVEKLLSRQFRYRREAEPEMFTPPQVAARLGVNAGKVLQWIRSGELRAIDVSTQESGRPRYRVSLCDLLAFENRRSCKSKLPSTRRQRQKPDITEFF